jgi:hypothetical protein
MRQLSVVVGLGAALVGLAFALGFFNASPEPTTIDAPVATEVPVAATPPAETPAVTPRPASPRPSAPRTPVVPTPEAPTATLRIDSDVPGAQVFVDNKFVGTSPATVNDVAPGQRKINVQAPGYESVAEFHTVSPGPRDIVISLKTIRLNEKAAVTHKHRLGSCQGFLVATPEGLRYETSHKEDAFFVALTDIETFEADFLKNNVKVRIRRGKTYDFADPSGKPDALYLFHQEVDKVRKRLSEGIK